MSGSALAQRAFWVLAAIALILLVMFLVVLVWMSGQASSLRAQEDDAKARLAEVENAVKAVDIEALQKTNLELDQKLSVLELQLPQRAYVPTLLKQIESEALETGNDVAETRPGELRKGKLITKTGTSPSSTTSTSSSTTEGDDQDKEGDELTGQRYDELDLVLRFRGSYHTAFGLLKRMGSHRKMMYIKDINLQRAADLLRPDGRAETTIDFDVTCFILEPAGGFPGRVVATVYE
jgi:Tfp pilus assembly protein PilO